MAHRFVVMIDGKLRVFTEFADIPQVIDHVIEFLPDYPPPPHTDEQHHDMEKWPGLLDELIRREHASSRTKG